MKKFCFLLVICGVISCFSIMTFAETIYPRAESPRWDVQQSETFRAGTNQSYYMVTGCNVYSSHSELVSYDEHKGITFGYYLEGMNHAVKYHYSNRDSYVTSGVLKYSFGGPINGWPFSVSTEHYY